MRRRSGVRSTVLVATAAVLAVLTPASAIAAPSSPPASPTVTGSATRTPTSTPTSTPSGTPTGTTSATPSATTPATKGIPATFTARLAELRAQATALQTGLKAKQLAATTAIALYTATTKKVQQALGTASAAQAALATANDELDAARTQVQDLARSTYIEGTPHTATALLLTSDPADLDFTVAALGYLADQGNAVFDRFTALEATATTYAANQQNSLASAKSLQTTADTQRSAALTALADVQTQQAAFVTAVTTLRNDAAKAAAAGPMSPADTAAYGAFLAELNALGAGITSTASGTTYVSGGPGITPLPGTSWVKPLLKYTISSCYCARWGTFHHGVDLAAPSGTPIYAVGAGTVVAAGPAQGFGNWVVVDHHDGSFSVYGHMRVLATVVGTQVRPGTLIAYVGDEGESTGFHLHFEVRIGSYASAADSTDPTIWLAQRGVRL